MSDTSSQNNAEEIRIKLESMRSLLFREAKVTSAFSFGSDHSFVEFITCLFGFWRRNSNVCNITEDYVKNHTIQFSSQDILKYSTVINHVSQSLDRFCQIQTDKSKSFGYLFYNLKTGEEMVFYRVVSTEEKKDEFKLMVHITNATKEARDLYQKAIPKLTTLFPDPIQVVTMHCGYILNSYTDYMKESVRFYGKQCLVHSKEFDENDLQKTKDQSIMASTFAQFIQLSVINNEFEKKASGIK